MKKMTEKQWVWRQVGNFIFSALFFISILGLGVVFYGMQHARAVVGYDVPLEVVALDVGQGDAILAQSGKDLQMLIDGGPSDQVLEKLGEHMPRGDRTIEYVILTHPDSDHVTGLVEVIRRYQIQNVLITGIVDYLPEYQEFLSEIKKNNVAVKIIENPQELAFGKAVVQILYPLRSLNNVYPASSNNTSIVTRIVLGENEILLTGDLEQEGEKLLFDSGVDLKADVFKAGHHGSKSSSFLEFVKAVKPDYVIISAGLNNSYGHPHYTILDRFRSIGARIFRTDLQGDITIQTDGKNLQVF